MWAFQKVVRFVVRALSIVYASIALRPPAISGKMAGFISFLFSFFFLCCLHCCEKASMTGSGYDAHLRIYIRALLLKRDSLRPHPNFGEACIVAWLSCCFHLCSLWFACFSSVQITLSPLLCGLICHHLFTRIWDQWRNRLLALIALVQPLLLPSFLYIVVPALVALLLQLQ